MEPSVAKKHANIVLAVVVIGVLMSAIDISIVILALPTIDSGLHAGTATSIWIIMAYLIVITVLSTQIGKLGDKYGRERMFTYGLVIFTAFSVLCGLAINVNMLIMSRVLQAVGGALIGATGTAVVSDYFEPHTRGRAFGFTAMGYNIGAVLGIFLGGFLSIINWRLIFLINLPIGVVVIALALKYLKDISIRKDEHFDMVGSALFGAALTLLSVFAIVFTYSGMDVTNTVILAFAFIFLAAFLATERNKSSPIIDYSVFKNRVLTLSMLSSVLQFTASFAVLFLLIIYMQGVRGINPFTSSLYLLPGYLVGAFLSPFTGRLSDKMDIRIPTTIGLSLILFAYLLYITFLTAVSPLYYVAIITIFSGVGASMFFPSNINAIMGNAPKDKYGVVSGINRTLNNIGMTLSFVIVLTVISVSIPRSTAIAIFLGSQIGGLSSALTAPFVYGMHAALYSSAVLIGIAIFVSLFRGRSNFEPKAGPDMPPTGPSID